MRGARLILLVACLATATLVGCWDNRRQLQRALDDGHVAIAEITGAQYQRTLPFALDGWRPRFVEQDLSVDLKWEGKDGKPRERKKVPVTEAFARTIVIGDQVRLLSLPVKVLDDDSAVPAIRPDATARLASLQIWITVTGYLALAAWVAFMAVTLWARKQGATGTGTPGGSAVGLPPRRTIVGVIALAGGAFLAFQAWSESRAIEAMASRGTPPAPTFSKPAVRRRPTRSGWPGRTDRGPSGTSVPCRWVRPTGARSRSMGCLQSTRPRSATWRTIHR